ncbi:MAG: hypothetical protein P4L10_00385 [Acidobacteriaceae bacterium]|nr:hypothetical protein [Acidobacteriaceae bacterium]
MSKSAISISGSGAFGNIISQAKSNPRIGYGIAIAVILSLATGLLYFSDFVDSDRQALVELQHQKSQLEALARDHDWGNRHQQAEALSVQLQSRLWEAETDGLARASFLDWLRGLATSNGVDKIDVHVEIDSNSTNALKSRKMSGTLAGSFTPQSLEALLDQLLRSDRMIIIERLRIQLMPLPRIEMMVSTYLRPGTKAEKPQKIQLKGP